MGELERPREKCTPYALSLNTCREQWNKQNFKGIVDFNSIWHLLSKVELNEWLSIEEVRQISRKSWKERYTMSLRKYNGAKKIKDK